MKILLIDKKETKTAIRAQLLEDLARSVLSTATSFEKGKELFEEDSFDLVIIDFTLDFGEELLRLILHQNPSQHLITISDNINCSELLGCDYCVEHYNKRRILKSTNINELISLINNFEFISCEYANKFLPK